MIFFNKKTSWSNAEFILLKLCVASAYIMVGAYFASFFAHYYLPLALLFAITVIWSVYLWVKKMRAQN